MIQRVPGLESRCRNAAERMAPAGFDVESGHRALAPRQVVDGFLGAIREAQLRSWISQQAEKSDLPPTSR